MKTNPGSDEVSLSDLLENQFGNYVVQHAFNLSSMERKRQIYDKIELAAAQGLVDRTHTYAKHVFNLVYSTFGDPRPKNDDKTGAGRNRNRHSNLS